MNRVEVVVIDDDESVCWLMQEILNLGNISHLVARTGPEGVQIVDRHGPRLAIIDIRLGSMNGLDVARRIHDICKDTQILFITSYQDIIEGKVDKDLPVRGIIEKPFNVEGLLKLIMDVLE